MFKLDTVNIKVLGIGLGTCWKQTTLIRVTVAAVSSNHLSFPLAIFYNLSSYLWKYSHNSSVYNSLLTYLKEPTSPKAEELPWRRGCCTLHCTVAWKLGFALLHKISRGYNLLCLSSWKVIEIQRTFLYFTYRFPVLFMSLSLLTSNALMGSQISSGYRARRDRTMWSVFIITGRAESLILMIDSSWVWSTATQQTAADSLTAFPFQWRGLLRELAVNMKSEILPVSPFLFFFFFLF